MQNGRKPKKKTCLKTSVFFTSIFFDFGFDFGLQVEVPKSDTFVIFFKMGPSGVQEAPKWPQERPKRPQEASKTRFLEIWVFIFGGFGHHVGSFLEFFLDMFGLQVLHMSRFMCFFTFLTFLAWGGYSKAGVRGGVKPSPGLGLGLFGDPNPLYTPGGSVASADFLPQIKIFPLVSSRCCCCWSCCCCFCSCFCCCHRCYYRQGGSKNKGSSRSRSRSSSSSSSSSTIWMRPGGKYLFRWGIFYFPGTPWAWEPLFVFPNSHVHELVCNATNGNSQYS